ncbi:helix-turn-helix transcriptional regulator [Rhodococcus sp. TAF43]|uniref:helix-turn-helix domain-containing protein n=1 Tax=Rhodococcus sp. TAF43 TaxID=3237483 RepID=UPI003F9BE846
MLDPALQRRLVASAAAAAGQRSTPAPAASGPKPAGLTPREREVLVLIAQALTNREIAARLFIGEVAVNTHINNLLAKAQ